MCTAAHRSRIRCCLPEHADSHVCQHTWGHCTDTRQHTHGKALPPPHPPTHTWASPYTPRQTCPRAQGPYTASHANAHRPLAHQRTGNHSQSLLAHARPRLHTRGAPPGQFSAAPPHPVHTHLTHTPRRQQVAGAGVPPRPPIPPNAPGTRHGLPPTPAWRPRVYDPAHRAEPRGREIACERQGMRLQILSTGK